MTGVLALGPARIHAQATPTPPAGKQFADQAEYDMYEAMRNDPTPATKLQKLDQWKAKYPTTAYSDERLIAYLTTYAGLNRPQDAVNSAKEILAKDPKNATAQYYIMILTRPLAGTAAPSPEVLDQGEKAASFILANITTPLPPLTDEQWTKARPEVEALADTTLGWIAMQRKNWQAAEDAFQKSLAINPNSGEVIYWMGTVVLSQKNPDKQSAALFYFARAAAYDGTGALPPEGRKTVTQYVQKAYNTYHGKPEGFDQLLQTAKTNPTPPAGFRIVSAAEIEKEKADAAAAEAAKNPQLAIWKGVKEALAGKDGATYFKSSMEGSLMPEFTGKVVSIDPAVHPKTVVIAIDGAAADATLKFEKPLPGKVEPGTVLSFQGQPLSYTASPLMVTFNVDKEHLKGWTGTGGPAPVRKPAPRRTTGKR